MSQPERRRLPLSGYEPIGTFAPLTVAEPGPTTFDPSTHVLYVADQASGSAGAIQAVDPVSR